MEMTMTYQNIREQVYQTVMKALDNDLIRLSAGNISTRTEDGHIAITPSGVKYTDLIPEQIAIIDLDGRPIDAPLTPTSETPMHTIIMRHLPEVGAIVHTHSLYAMTFAVLGQAIPNINLETLVCGAPIPVAEWACPGTSDPGERLVELFQAKPELKVALLRNHGLVAIGKDLAEAYEIALDAEVAAQVYHQALQVGTPITLTDEQVAEVWRVYT
jgi:L-ribulose-5-phosphate 4-epimerase